MATDQWRDGREAGTLELLLRDYEASRADQRNLVQVIAAVLAASIILMGALGSLLNQSCSAGHIFSGCSPKYWPPVYALLPLAPAAVLAFMGLLGLLATMRAYYIRSIELQLRDLRIRALDLDQGGSVPPASFEHIAASLQSQRRGPLRIRLLFGSIYLAIGVFGAGVSALSLFLVRPLDLQIAAAVFYCAYVVILIMVAFSASLQSQPLWQRLIEQLDAEYRSTSRLITGSRTIDPRAVRKGLLFRYLLLPRPTDLIVKGSFLLGGALLGFLIHGGQSGASWFGAVIATYFAFEVLFYQGRYTLNDIRGAAADARHSRGKARTRFPVEPATGLPSRHDVMIGLAVVSLRWAVAAWIAVRALSDRDLAAVAAAASATLVVGLIYDTLRSVSDGNDACYTRFKPIRRPILLVLVGVGYGVRGVLGWTIGTPQFLDGTLDVLLMLGLVLFGVMFCAMTWTIDGLHLLVKPQTNPRVEPTDRRVETLTFRPAIADSPQIGPLLAQLRTKPGRERHQGWGPELVVIDGPLNRNDALPRLIPEDAKPVTKMDSSDGGAWEACYWPVLAPVRSTRAWWNAAFILSAGLAGAAGGRMAAPSSWIAPLAAAAVLVVGALLEVHFARGLGIVAAGSSAPLIVWLGHSGIGLGIAGAVFSLTVIVTYVFFRNMNMRDLDRFLPDIGRAFYSASGRLIRLIVAVLIGGVEADQLFGFARESLPNEQGAQEERSELPLKVGP